jgi:streptomycin 6-kinase
VDLSSRVTFSIDRWHLDHLTRLSGGFRSDVFACTTADGQNVVLKLTVTTDEARMEAAALHQWKDRGVAVHLIDADLDHCALLLQRIQPGTPLPGNDDAVAIDVVSALLRRLHRAASGAHVFPTLAQLYPTLEAGSREDAAYEQRATGDPTRGLIGLQRLDRARATATRLCQTTNRAVLLHGDILDKNLLRDGDRYLAIDPIPRVGDPCSDVGFFASGHPPATAILERATAIAVRMDLDAQRCRQWAAVWAVQEATSAWRPDQAELESFLTSDAFEHLHAQ